MRLHFSRAQLRLDAASTSSKHLYSQRLSCLGGKQFGEETFFLPFSAVLIENRFDIYSLWVCERKDRVVWQGFNHAGAVFECCSVLLNWTVLPLKILN